MFNKPKKQQKSKELLRDEKKQIKCEFEENAEECKYDCDDCAINIKTKGDIALMIKQYDLAIEYYKEALEKEPRMAEAWVNLGSSYGWKNDYVNALIAFNNAIDYDMTYGKALLGKAITLRNMEELDAAIECIDSILELYDNDQCKKIKADILALKDDSNNLSSYKMDLLKELLDTGRNEGYINAKSFPFVPELTTNLSYLVSQIISAIHDLNDPELSPIINLIWCCFAGIGATMHWHVDWQELKKTGIFNTLTKERGIFAMDEYVLDVIGANDQTEEGINLLEHIGDIASQALFKITEELEHLNKQEKVFIFNQTCQAMYMYGMAIELNRIGMH